MVVRMGGRTDGERVTLCRNIAICYLGITPPVPRVSTTKRVKSEKGGHAMVLEIHVPSKK